MSGNSHVQDSLQASLPGTEGQQSREGQVSSLELMACPAACLTLSRGQSPLGSHVQADDAKHELQQPPKHHDGEDRQLVPQVQFKTEPEGASSLAHQVVLPAADIEVTFAAPALQRSPLSSLSTPVLSKPTPRGSAEAASRALRLDNFDNVNAPSAFDTAVEASANIVTASAASTAQAKDDSCMLDKAQAAVPAQEPNPTIIPSAGLSSIAAIGVAANQGHEMTRSADSTASHSWVQSPGKSAAVADPPSGAKVATDPICSAAAQSAGSSAAMPAGSSAAAVQSPGNAAAVLAWLNALATPASVGPSSSHYSTPSEPLQLTPAALSKQVSTPSLHQLEALASTASELEPKQATFAVPNQATWADPQQAILPEPTVTPAAVPQQATAIVPKEVSAIGSQQAVMVGSCQAVTAVSNQATPITALQATSMPVGVTPPMLLQQVASAKTQRTVMSGLTTPASAATQMHR